MLEEYYTEQKEKSGQFATFVWSISGLYLFAVHETATFFSWQALVYFLVLVFVAALILGWFGYGLQRGLAKVIVKVTEGEVSPGTALVVQVLGLLIFGLEIWVGYKLADYTVSNVLY